MVSRATPALLLLTALAVTPPTLHAQTAALEKGCKRQTVKPPHPSNTKEGALNAARVKVVEGVRERVARRAAEAAITEPKGIFVLRAEKDRSKVSFAENRTNLPNPLLEGVAAEAGDLFADWPEKGAASVFVRLDSLPIPHVPIGGERVSCAVRALNADEMIRELQRQIALNRTVGSKGGKRAKVRFILTREGEVLAPELSSFSGNYQWDRIALDVVRQLRFAPARVDGVPRDVWATIPVDLKGSGK